MATKPFVPPNRDTQYVAERMPVPRSWSARRPGEVSGDPDAAYFGDVGPDLGYAGTLTYQFQDRLVPGAAHRGDVNAAALAVARRRASDAGRGPIAEDLAVSYLLLGVLDGVPGDWSRAGARVAHLIDGVRFDANRANAVADSMAIDWLDAKPDEVREKLVAEGADALYPA